MAVTEQEIIITKELERIADDLQGVRDVQDLYGNMPSENYKILLIADRDSLQVVKEKVDELINSLPNHPNEEGERQFVLMVNNPNPNKPFFMDDQTKNGAIDAFKGAIPIMDDQLEQAYEAKKAELDAL